MRVWGFLALMALVALVADAKLKKKKSQTKDEDWEGLEDMLKQIDEIEAKKTKVVEGELRDDDDEEFDHEADDEKSAEKAVMENPCEDHHCGWGKECMLNKDNEPHCECIRECPSVPDLEDSDKVCSNQNETFDSICHLYRERCLCRNKDDGCEKKKHHKVHLEYLGQCKRLTECTEEHLEQFPQRMSDWLFQVMKDLNDREQLHGDDWINMLTEAESDEHLKHVYPVVWKFCDLDAKPHDKEVSHHELIPITAPVMPMESCIKPFLKRCDTNDNNKISLSEWGKCLGLKKGEIIERC